MKQAIFKIIKKKQPHAYRNKDALEKVIGYVLRKTARLEDDLWGSIGTFGKSFSSMIEDFRKVKRLYDKEDGLQLKHLILSWGERPDLPRKKIRKLIKRTLAFWGEEYQLIYAVHEDKLPNGYHMHIVLNSVSNKGNKIQITSKRLSKFKKHFNKIWNPYEYILKMNQDTRTIEDKSFECDW